MGALAEFYESGNAPHEALGRAARRLSAGGALYLGGGIGIERQRKNDGDVFRVAKGSGSAKEFPGPLSAAIHAFTLAGGSTSPDTPGGATKVADPAVAARLRELTDEEVDARRDIDRYTRRLARVERSAQTQWSPVARPDDDWEKRRIEELKADIARIAGERAKLLKTGKLTEGLVEAETGKPGTNWKQVAPAARKKVDPLVKHWMSKPQPFGACYAELAPEKGAEAAKRICAVVKDMGRRSTKWRKGGAKASKAQESFLDLAIERLDTIDAALGAGMAIAIAEGGDVGPDLADLSEMVVADLALLALAGHPLAEAVFGVEEAFANTATSADAAARKRLGQRSSGQGAGNYSPGSSTYDETKHKRAAKGATGGGRFVTKGSSGAQVRAVQQRVGAKADGKYGPKTAQAVKDFQRRHRLVVDGVVGKQTALAMSGQYAKARASATGALTDGQRTSLSGRKAGSRPKGTAPTRARGGAVVG